MRNLYYDRQGKPISLEEWARLYGDRKYSRVAETSVGGVRVSTVWLGLDHNYLPEGPPLIFETMAFGGPMDAEPYLWATEQEAIEGHELAVAAVRLGAQ